jgi:hypothetical protein
VPEGDVLAGKVFENIGGRQTVTDVFATDVSRGLRAKGEHIRP